MTKRPCADCGGARLRPESLAVRVGGVSIADWVKQSVDRALETIRSLSLPPREASIAEPIKKELRARLEFLRDVGVGYLTLDRAASTLSGGEAQRIRLATQIGSRLTGVLYILDEPSIGLHPRDNRKLLDTLLKLRDLGQFGAGGRARSGDDGGGRPHRRLGAGRRAAGRLPRGAGLHRRDPRFVGFAHRPVPLEPARDRDTGGEAAGERRLARGRRRAAQQSEEDPRPLPARHLRLRDRRVGVGQEHARERHPLPRAGEEAPRRQGGARRPRSDSRTRSGGQGGRDRSVADRPDAALQPGHLHRRLHAHPGPLRPGSRGQGPRLHAGAVQLQRQGRPVRGVRG